MGARLNAPRRLRIVFVLTRFTVGGAEMMLYKLVSRMNRTRFDPHVIGLADRPDGMRERFQQLGVATTVLDMHRGVGAASALFRLARMLRRIQPDIVQGWLYHGNLAATAARALARIGAPVIWNVRGTLPSPEERNYWSKLVIRASGLFSRFPAKIVNNSLAAAVEHEERLNYPARARVVLPNGFDTALFHPSPEARASVRAELALPAHALLVGLFARYHPMKSHADFLRAAAIVAPEHPGAHFVLAGAGVSASSRELTQLIGELGLAGHVELLGLRNDIPRITAALDIACCASAYGEGFPNVIGEAMSCGVPCVATASGDTAHVIADTGHIVPTRDPQAFARALADLIRLGAEGRAALGTKARARIVENFSLDHVVRLYETLYEEVVDSRRSGSAHALGTSVLKP